MDLQPDLPPPATFPPPPPPAKRRRTLWIAVAILAVGAAGGVAYAVTRSDKASKVTVEYSITIQGTNCGHGAYDIDGYNDIDEGTDVEVFDGAGKLLGFGSLGKCTGGALDANYTATFEITPADTYRVTSGNQNRGFLNYKADDVVGGVLVVQAVLGD